MRIGTNYCVYEVDNLPGCSQVAVSHSVFMKPAHRGKGHGKSELELRISQYVKLGYDYVMCTTMDDNVKEIECLEHMGFHRMDSFRSSKTGHTVVLWGLGL